MNIILIGPPASGKGTMAKTMSKDFGFAHISTGEIFRDNIKKGTPLGDEVKDYLDKAVLVPDEITVNVIKKRILEKDCEKGIIFDGFPRNMKQAEMLETFAKIDAVIFLDVDLSLIEKRILGRKTCSVCEKIYNTSTYNSDTCECGGKLYTRKDDDVETIRKRYKIYENETAPLLEYYKDQITKFSAKDTPDQTYQPVKEFLEDLQRRTK
ncbi:MAG: nucleoside monophosphate kinase [Clostridia bacterium]|jgi:adenylate kinase|nr:nucleoside monophosphate kinase [Clostridia bacterium]MDD4408452.1 nucleoside monophosphate kinase [Clostridia bacterium]